MVTSVTPIIEQQHRPRAQAHAGGQDVHLRFYFVAYIDPSTSTTQLANETPDQSHIEDRKRAGEYCCNQQYSVTAITTSTGAISERYAYSAYGQPTILDTSGSILNASAISNRYTYTGREWDATLGLYHFRARWMSPSAGRFLGRDPIGYEGSEWGLYQYVESKALVYTDPTGYEKASVCLAEFRACITKSAEERDRCVCKASDEARVCIKNSADEAWRQFVECDRIAALTRDLAIAECARRNDQNTLIGQIGYRACQGAALALYSSASTECATTYIAAEASIAAACLAFEGGRVIACGIVWQYSNSECDTELSVCLRR